MKEFWLKRWSRQQSQLEKFKLVKWEWLDCNDLGSHSSSSWLQINTRKYHGLLVAAVPGLDDRWMVWNCLEESVIEENRSERFLTGHYYPGQDMSSGIAENLESVERRLDGHVCWCYTGSGWKITREQLLMRRSNSVLLRYLVDNASDRSLKFRVRPLLAIRDFHQLQHAGDNIRYCTMDVASGACFSLVDDRLSLGLYLQSTLKPQRFVQNVWYYNVIYPRECERGYDYQEDLFCPEYWEYNFEPGRHELILVGGMEAQDKEQLAGLWHRELTDRYVERLEKGRNVISVLRAGASKFIVKQHEMATKIIAGYPWFLSWGRDTMIALPGLTVFNDRILEARSILSYYAGQLRDGLIPNYLGSTPEHHAYNSVDASLWWAWAVYQYWLVHKQDVAQIPQEWLTALVSIWRCYSVGTRYNIKVNENTGLLYVGGPDWNLTWMDANVNGKPVTARYGYAVEINALWYNLICLLSRIELVGNQRLTGHEQSLIDEQMVKFRDNFKLKFWYADGGYLYDYVNDYERNSQFRPNQLWAVVLAADLFDHNEAKTVLDLVDKRLFTPYGLRTLDVDDSQYHGVYRGTQVERDVAYHNGTVWPWLLGCFFEAALKYWESTRVRNRWQECLQAMEWHLLNEECVGGISEVFDGDAPHTAGGTVDQAWSVGELLRIAYMMDTLKD